MDRLQLILLNIGFSVHQGDWNWKNVNSPFVRIYYIKEGAAKIHLAHRVQSLRPGCLYILPPFTLHSYECDASFAHYYIHFYEQLSGHLSLFDELELPTEVEAKEIDIRLIERLIEINPNRELQQFDPLVYDNQTMLLRNLAEDSHLAEYTLLETKGILFQLLARFMKHASIKTQVQDQRIQLILDYIRKHIHQSLSLDQLTGICNLSKDHLIRLFKRELNCTPIRFINQKKIEKAQLMLLLENASVKDVAYFLAFENVSYFNRVFKSITGYTPTQYCLLYKKDLLSLRT